MNSINGKIALEGKEITKGFKMGRESLMILKDISIKINVGDFISIMGPAGSGKSTLLYILGGLDKPSTGKVLMNGEDISKFSDDKQSVMRRRNIGFVFQFYNLIPNLNVEENILLPVLLDGNKTKDYKKELDNILEIVGLTERRKHTPKELSGGQQQRVAIARALINNPEIIFADEPTGNLDSKTGTEIMELLRKINRENKKTIIMVTHSMETAEYGNRVVNIKDGGIV